MENKEKMAVLGELKDSQEMFVYLSPCTKMPFVYCDPETFDDEVLLFRTEELAKNTAKEFLEKKIPLQLAKLDNKQFLIFYSSLYAMGVNELSLDMGGEKPAKVALNELVRRPDASQLPEGKIRGKPGADADLPVFYAGTAQKSQTSGNSGIKRDGRGDAGSFSQGHLHHGHSGQKHGTILKTEKRRRLSAYLYRHWRIPEI